MKRGGADSRSAMAVQSLCLDSAHADRLAEVLARRDGRSTALQRRGVVLRVRNLEASRANLDRTVDDRLQSLDILAVDYGIGGERELSLMVLL